MGAIASMFRPREVRALTASEWLLKAMAGGSQTYTGKSVAIADSLAISTVWAAVTYLTETISTLPLHVYRRSADGGRSRATDHYLWPILRYQPNPEMTAVEFWEAAIGHLELWGNSYAEIERLGSGRVSALWPLRPDRMRVARSQAGALEYTYTMPSGEQKTLPSYRILHLRNLSRDGIYGLSRIALAREGIGLALAAEEYGARTFSNGALPVGVLTHPKSLSVDAHKRLRDDWESMHRGLSNSHRVAVLEEGVQWQAAGMPNTDLQWIELQKLKASDFAAIFRVPPHKVGIMDRATFSNIEHQAIEAVTDTIRPRCVRIEQRLFQDLFTEDGQKELYPEFLIDGLLRGDTATRTASYAVARANGWLNGNEIRALENLNPIPGPEGDEYWRPANILGATAPTPSK